MSPAHRSLQDLKALGYAANVVERWNPFAKVRQDVFSADLIGLKAGAPVLAIHCSSGANHAAHCYSVFACPARQGAVALSTTSHDSQATSVPVWAELGDHFLREEVACGRENHRINMDEALAISLSCFRVLDWRLVQRGRHRDRNVPGNGCRFLFNAAALKILRHHAPPTGSVSLPEPLNRPGGE